MMHLYYGVSVTYQCWKNAREKTTPTLFVKTLATGIWGKKTNVKGPGHK